MRAISPKFKFREDSEVPVLASLILLYKVHKDRGYTSDNINTLLFNTDTQSYICNKLGISQHSFNKAIKSLREKEAIVGNNVNDNLVPDKLTVVYNFEEIASNIPT